MFGWIRKIKNYDRLCYELDLCNIALQNYIAEVNRLSQQNRRLVIESDKLNKQVNKQSDKSNDLLTMTKELIKSYCESYHSEDSEDVRLQLLKIMPGMSKLICLLKKKGE